MARYTLVLWRDDWYFFALILHSLVSVFGENRGADILFKFKPNSALACMNLQQLKVQLSWQRAFLETQGSQSDNTVLLARFLSGQMLGTPVLRSPPRPFRSSGEVQKFVFSEVSLKHIRVSETWIFALLGPTTSFTRILKLLQMALWEVNHWNFRWGRKALL